MLYKASDLPIRISYRMSAQSMLSSYEDKTIQNILISTPTMFPDSQKLHNNLAAETIPPEKLVYSQASSTDLLTIRYRTIPFGRSTVMARLQHDDTTRTIVTAHSHAPIVKTYHTAMDGTIRADMRTSMRWMMPENGRLRTISWKRLPLRDPVDTDFDKTATNTDANIIEHLHATLVASIRTGSRSDARMTMMKRTAASTKRFVRACMPAERMPKRPNT